jgi:hypothetical protein
MNEQTRTAKGRGRREIAGSRFVLVRKVGSFSCQKSDFSMRISRLLAAPISTLEADGFGEKRPVR